MPATFRALQHRGFRLMWTGLIVSAVGTWMQIVAQSLLVLSITNDSPVALGTVSLAQASSFLLFALVGGGVADRFDKRRLLLVTQSLCVVLATTLGVLTQLGLVRVWMVVGIAFLNGAVLSFDQPTRGALIPELVPREDLMNAISLQSAVFSGASALGPVLAGLAAASFGLAANFFLNAASYFAVVIALLRLGPHQTPAKRAPAPLLRSLGGLLRHLREEPVLPWVLSAYGALLFLGPSPPLLLPIFAKTVLHVDDARRLGLLFSASGVGTVVGSFTLASFGDVERKGRLLLGSILLWSVALASLGASRSMVVAMASLFVIGFAATGVATTGITLLTTRVPEAMRGRVMSLNTLLVMGARPLGDFPASALIAWCGAPIVTVLAGSLVGAWGLVILTTRRAVREA